MLKSLIARNFDGLMAASVALSLGCIRMKPTRKLSVSELNAMLDALLIMLIRMR